jgi:hypothetical protein
MKIKAYRRDVYGRETIYVADPLHAATLRALTGKKTIDHADIHALTLLGVSVDIGDYDPRYTRPTVTVRDVPNRPARRLAR